MCPLYLIIELYSNYRANLEKAKIGIVLQNGKDIQSNGGDDNQWTSATNTRRDISRRCQFDYDIRAAQDAQWKGKLNRSIFKKQFHLNLRSSKANLNMKIFLWRLMPNTKRQCTPITIIIARTNWRRVLVRYWTVSSEPLKFKSSIRLHLISKIKQYLVSLLHN